jgi:hypothetical protein
VGSPRSTSAFAKRVLPWRSQFPRGVVGGEHHLHSGVGGRVFVARLRPCDQGRSTLGDKVAVIQPQVISMSSYGLRIFGRLRLIIRRASMFGFVCGEQHATDRRARDRAIANHGAATGSTEDRRVETRRKGLCWGLWTTLQPRELLCANSLGLRCRIRIVHRVPLVERGTRPATLPLPSLQLATLPSAFSVASKKKGNLCCQNSSISMEVS